MHGMFIENIGILGICMWPYWPGLPGCVHHFVVLRNAGFQERALVP